MSKYKVMTAPWCEEPQEKEEIGSADTFQECCQVLKKYIIEQGYEETPYWRFLMGKQTTFIDFGVSGKYGAIQPPITLAQLNGEED